MHHSKLCESLRLVNESLRVAWKWEGKEKLAYLAPEKGKKKTVKLEGSSVINWPSTKIISSSFLELCTKFDSSYVRERKRKK